jgi:hypothetical protein
MIFQVPVDFNYFEFLKIKLIKGRYFLRDMATDSAKFEIPANKKVEGSSSVRTAIVVNESLYNLLGQPPLDEINGPMGARIIGFVMITSFLIQPESCTCISHDRWSIWFQLYIPENKARAGSS